MSYSKIHSNTKTYFSFSAAI